MVRVAALAAALLVVLACSGKKDSTEESPSASAAGPVGSAAVDRAGPATGQLGDPAKSPAAGSRKPTGKLCIEPTDLQIEPLDLEALDDEMPVVKQSDAQGRALESMHGHGTPIALTQGQLAVPTMRCTKSGCRAGVAVLDQDGTERLFTPLPGPDRFDPGSEHAFVAALADVNSDGKADLWVGYQGKEPHSAPGGAPAVNTMQSYRVAALSVPDFALQWHSVLRRTLPPESDASCDGELYPVDADCDGDGDLVLAMRCGRAKCLGDERDPACKIQELHSVYLWDVQRGLYSDK